MFKVMDCGKSAVLLDGLAGWDNCEFETFDEALSYARMWLGPYWGSWDGDTGIVLAVNEKYYYYTDCYIEIVECSPTGKI